MGSFQHVLLIPFILLIPRKNMSVSFRVSLHFIGKSTLVSFKSFLWKFHFTFPSSSIAKKIEYLFHAYLLWVVDDAVKLCLSPFLSSITSFSLLKGTSLSLLVCCGSCFKNFIAPAALPCRSREKPRLEGTSGDHLITRQLTARLWIRLSIGPIV